MPPTNKSISVSRSALDALETQFPNPTAAITMLNLLRFHSTAQYPPTTSSSEISGREAYLTRYIPAFQTLAAQISDTIRPIFLGTPTFDLVTRASVAVDLLGGDVRGRGEDQTPTSSQHRDAYWDVVALVTYPSFHAFRTLIESPEYLAEADPHRRASLYDWRLIATRAVEPTDL